LRNLTHLPVMDKHHQQPESSQPDSRQAVPSPPACLSTHHSDCAITTKASNEAQLLRNLPVVHLSIRLIEVCSLGIRRTSAVGVCQQTLFRKKGGVIRTDCTQAEAQHAGKTPIKKLSTQIEYKGQTWMEVSRVLML
jgi:hypothetical protein